MAQEQKIPQPIKNAVDELVQKYSESEATTKAGRWLRFIARFITVDALIKIIAHKSRK